MWQKRNFDLWLNQPVNSHMDDEPFVRRDYIPDFADSLTDFIKSKGYRFDTRWKLGHLVVAKWLYTIHIRHATLDTTSFPYQEIHHRNTIEDIEHYNNIISDEELHSFLKAWGHTIDDLCIDTFIGVKIAEELKNLIWIYINLDISPQGIAVAEWLFQEDSDSEGEIVHKKFTDQYHQDMADGYHG